jgi:DNA polymerase-1
LPPAGTEDALYVIDLSGYVFRAYHAIAPLSSPRGEPTHAVMGTVNMLQKVIGDRKPSHLAVVMDSKTGTFRSAIDERYKANRPPPPPDLSMQMDRCEQIVRAQRLCLYQRDGVEADDLIACLVAKATAAGMRVIIVSADKDLMQLVEDESERVVLWDSMRDKVYGPSEVREKFGVPPSQVRDLLALMGDTSDNVPGVPGVGPKTAADLIREFGSLEGIYASLDAIKKPKLRESLATHESDARVSQTLVTLKCDLEIDFDPQKLRVGDPDREELRRLYAELGFTRLLDQVKPPPPKERRYECIFDLEALRNVVAQARARGRVALDTETTDVDPMRAVLIGVSLSVEPAMGYYVPIAHRYLGAPTQLAWREVADVLRPLLEDPSVEKVAHDLKYDVIVLARHGLAVRGRTFDTMIASYLLDPEMPNTLKELARREFDIGMTSYDEVTRKQRGSQLAFDAVPCDEAGKYAAASAEVSFSLAERFGERVEREGLGALLSELEMPLSRVLAQMEMTGVLVDAAFLATLGAEIDADLKAIEAKAKALVGREFSVRSRDQLETILFDELKLPVVKRTPKGGRSTDADVLEELAERHDLPRAILEYRELDKLKGTYIDALPKAIHPETGRIHTHFGQTTAATGRLASSDPNLQNIPIRTELGRRIRAAFVAPEGHAIVSADYSQIELRVLAHLAQDAELIRAFQSDGDVHTHTASLVFGVPRDEVTAEMRRRSKTINFGVIYGMGDSALAKSLGISRDEAARFIEAYFARYAGVARFMEQTIEAARRGEAVRTILGRRRFLPNLHSANRGLRMEAERIAKNTPIQGTAADILKRAMVALGENPVLPGVKMVLTVHDELVFEVPSDRVAEASGRIREVMASAMKLDVPLVVDVGSGPNWSAAH